ncbi:MAG TPA: FeoB-associated Cys-rich membrane protein [Firmicutes bacterium]|nr:FeoB-associated Cys-rich membrane protein [Bacillota bacterium]
MSWLWEQSGTIFVLLIVIAVVVLILYSLRRDKQKGRSPCGGHCGHCPMGGACHSKKDPS